MAKRKTRLLVGRAPRPEFKRGGAGRECRERCVCPEQLGTRSSKAGALDLRRSMVKPRKQSNGTGAVKPTASFKKARRREVEKTRASTTDELGDTPSYSQKSHQTNDSRTSTFSTPSTLSAPCQPAASSTSSTLSVSCRSSRATSRARKRCASPFQLPASTAARDS